MKRIIIVFLLGLAGVLLILFGNYFGAIGWLIAQQLIPAE